MHRRDEPRDKVREVWVVSRTLHLNMGFVGNHGGRKVERWSPGREHWQDVREDLADYQRSAPGGRDRCFGLEVGAAVEGDPHLAFGRHRHRPQVCLAGASRVVAAKQVQLGIVRRPQRENDFSRGRVDQDLVPTGRPQ